ncbi:MAG: hypothetical protein RL418_294 [Actinomycetota bacterium]|jgi:hypothetical protein
MTEFMTRRELREMERKGLAIPAAQSLPQVVAPEPVPEVPAAPPQQPQVFLSRRELREAERNGLVIEPQATSVLAQKEQTGASVEIELPDVEILDEEIASAELEQIVSSENLILDLTPTDFTGNNLLAEPSTQSIVLEVAPEAIALPIETGEIAVTGSIAVLAEPTTGSITGGLDGIELDNADRQDAVTGVISIVEPISALDVINARVGVGVVPKSVLRKGWWRPWAIAVAALVMAISAILATVTILNAIG